MACSRAATIRAAEEAADLGLRVIAQAEELGITYAPTPTDVARSCDILSVHLALNDETRGMVDEALLAELPDGAFIINTSRGDVVDQAALEKAVRERGMRAGLDVFADEPTSGQGSIEVVPSKAPLPPRRPVRPTADPLAALRLWHALAAGNTTCSIA